MKFYKTYKIKSFTILEIIVTMIISSLVTVFSISMYLNTQNSFKDYISSSEKYNSFLNVINIIKIDLEKAEFIRNSNSGIEILNNKTSVIYYFNSQEIIRKTYNQTDTFNIEVIDFNTETFDNNNEYVKSVDILVRIDNFNLDLKINKEYSNAIMYNIIIRD